MARQKNIIPKYITFDMEALAAHVMIMNNEELGKWWRKAINDLRCGCYSNDVDPLVKYRYELALKRMQVKQEINANAYKQSKKAGASIRKDENEHEPAGNGMTSESATPATIESFDDGKKTYGPSKLVRLTDEEGHHLRELYGQDLELAIEILDAAIVNAKPRSKVRSYKSHFAVMRRGNWVWERIQQNKLTEQRLKNAQAAKNNTLSFKERDAMHRGEMAKFLMGEATNE